jgi:hypothetical protein
MSKFEEWKAQRVTKTQALKAVEYRKAGGNADCSNCARSFLAKNFPYPRCCNVISQATGFQEMVSHHKTCKHHLNPANISTHAKA